MILGVLADTHSLPLPAKMLQAFKSVKLIIHAGDICDQTTLKILQNIAPVKAVQGNMEEALVRKKLPLQEIIQVEGRRIGVCHGHEGGAKEALANARAQFKDNPPDIVIFGHSHRPLNEQIGPTLFFNPGSPNDKVRAPYCSYGLIDVTGGHLKASIVKL